MAAGMLDAEARLRAGNPREALLPLQDHIRAHPGDAKPRVFLFQLLCVLGEWERALKQLDLVSTLDASALAMAQTYRDAVPCELLRAQVFAGRKSPMIFGEPEPWLALLIEALLREGHGDAATQALRDQAFDAAPAQTGKVDGQAFQWLADADMRLGPVLEAIINGRYYWVPFARLTRVHLEAPADLRDCVWMPAHLWFDNGGESVALIPTRYPGSESDDDGLIALARKTVWNESQAGLFTGLGQRILATDAGELGLMDIREIEFDPAAEAPAEAG